MSSHANRFVYAGLTVAAAIIAAVVWSFLYDPSMENNGHPPESAATVVTEPGDRFSPQPATTHSADTEPDKLRQALLEQDQTRQQLERASETVTYCFGHILRDFDLSADESTQVVRILSEIWVMAESWDRRSGKSHGNEAGLLNSLWQELDETLGPFHTRILAAALENPRTTHDVYSLLEKGPIGFDPIELGLEERAVLLAAANAVYSIAESSWLNSMTGIETTLLKDGLSHADQEFLAIISNSLALEKVSAIRDRIRKINRQGVVPIIATQE